MKNVQERQPHSEDDLAQQLCYEAQQLAALYPGVLPTAAELRVPASSSWHRIATLSAAAGLIALVGAGVLTVAISRSREEQTAAVTKLVAPEVRPREADAVAETTPQPAAPKHTELVAESAVLEIPDALEFVISEPNDEGGYDVVASGIYVPERRETVPLSQLSPAERYAVEQLLGEEKDEHLRRPI